MIVLSGEIAVDPDQHDQLIELVDAVEPPSRDEPGCQAYQFWLHRTERGVVHVFEIWDDADAVAVHVKSDHYRSFARGLRGLDVKRLDIAQYDASILG